jgi:hypothetical protein
MFQERLGWPIVAVKSEAVGSWTWTMATGGESGPPVVYHGLDGPRTGPVPGELPQVEVPQPWTLRTA